jgi:hypothetical protein
MATVIAQHHFHTHTSPFRPSGRAIRIEPGPVDMTQLGWMNRDIEGQRNGPIVPVITPIPQASRAISRVPEADKRE